MKSARRIVPAAVLACFSLLVLGASAALAAFPVGKNGVIAYHRYDGMQFDAFAMSGDGTGQLNLTNDPGYQVGPSFSPEGRRIVLSRSVPPVGHTDIFVMGADGSNPVNLTNTPDVSEQSPVFSPDGLTIIFNDEEEQPVVELYRMNADGSGRVPLTSTAGVREARADFSPDGRRIAFERCAADCDIYTMAPDGSGLGNLTPNTPGSDDGEPAFSPDGRRIAFGRFEGVGTRTQLTVMNADGASPVTFTNSPTSINSPSFSADGRKLTYSSAPMGDTPEIYSIGSTAPGDPPVNLTKTPMPLREENPVWQSLHNCAGRAVTIVGDDGPDTIKGTKRADVIAAFGGKDKILGRGGNDRICAGAGKDRIAGGGGKKDLCRGGKGRDKGGKGCERGKL